MKYYLLRKKELSKIRRAACLELGSAVCEYVESSKSASVLKLNDSLIVMIDDFPAFITDSCFSRLIPTLFLIRKLGHEGFKNLEVDEGAVHHILNGADVMIPGIVEYGEFKEGDLVVVISPKKAALSVGKALLNSSELKERGKGKAVKTLHYAGDKFWRSSLSFLRKHHSQK